MFRRDKSTGSGRFLSPVTWVQLALTVALILVLSGCGVGSSSGGSGKEETGGNGPTSGQTGGQSTPETTTQTQETEKTTEQASTDGELGTPALGDPGAPVVMVEYADYQ